MVYSIAGLGLPSRGRRERYLSSALKIPPGTADTKPVERSEKISGEWNIANAEELRDQLSALVESGGDLVLDLSAVASCDTAALQLLYSLRRTAAERGLRLRFQDLPPAILDTAQALGLNPAELTEGAADGL